MARKLSKNQKILCSYLAEYAQTRTRENTNYQLIIDKQRHHYQVVRMHWDRNIFQYMVIFHFEIKADGKIWLWVNNTDILVAEELVNLGIPAHEIVLGFHSPQMRAQTGFAVV